MNQNHLNTLNHTFPFIMPLCDVLWITEGNFLCKPVSVCYSLREYV